MPQHGFPGKDTYGALVPHTLQANASPTGTVGQATTSGEPWASNHPPPRAPGPLLVTLSRVCSWARPAASQAEAGPLTGESSRGRLTWEQERPHSVTLGTARLW